MIALRDIWNDLYQTIQLYRQLSEMDAAYCLWPLPQADEVARLEELTSDLPAIQESHGKYLQDHFGSDLFTQDHIKIHPMTKDWAWRTQCFTGACSIHDEIYILPRTFNNQYPEAINHEWTHSWLYEEVRKRDESVEIPLWFNEAVALETEGHLLGGAHTRAWFSSQRNCPSADGENEHYVYGALFYATWVDVVGPEAWNELIRAYIEDPKDLYVVVASVAEKHGISGFENKEKIAQTTQSWFHRAAQKSQIAGVEAEKLKTSLLITGRNLNIVHTGWEEFVDAVRQKSKKDSQYSVRLERFVQQYPEHPLSFYSNAFLVVDALDRSDVLGAQEALDAFNRMAEQYDIDSYMPVEKVRALICLQKNDWEGFRDALSCSLEPEENVFTRVYNAELVDYLNYPVDWPQMTLEEFTEEFRRFVLR